MKSMSEISNIISSHMEAVKNKVQAQMAQLGRNASGKTSSSLQVVSTDDAGILYGSAAFLALEHGRGPGAVPRNFIDIIKTWIKAKGISVKSIPGRATSTISPQERGLNSLAGAIAHNIMTKGTKMHREKKNDDIFSTVLSEELDAMGRSLVINLKDKVSTINNELK